MIKEAFYDCVPQLDALPNSLIEMAMTRAVAGSHDDLARQVGALNAIESPAPPFVARAADAQRLRIASWNLERCKSVEDAAALLTGRGADLCLLSEMDYGMARSGNRNTTRDLAAQLRAQYAYVVEFVELGLGNPQEEAAHAGETNRSGFHGNAVISRYHFSRPFAMRLDDGAAWFDLGWHHPRLGGRNALAVTVHVGGREFVTVSAHLENLSTPEGRAQQVQRLLHHLESYANDRPIIIAGDFNTAALPESSDGADGAREWFADPVQLEPLFGAFRTAGFDWIAANTTDQTRRVIDDGRPKPSFSRLDWFFVRGVRVSNPRTVPAVGPDNRVLSDHELITLDVAFD